VKQYFSKRLTRNIYA